MSDWAQYIHVEVHFGSVSDTESMEDFFVGAQSHRDGVHGLSGQTGMACMATAFLRRISAIISDNILDVRSRGDNQKIGSSTRPALLIMLPRCL
jgi:hypothetical protein